MEVMGSDRGSDFITNFAFVPPSPPLDPVFDYPAFDLAPSITSPPLPHTPSYNGGSYYSPYTQNSELSFSGDDIQLQDFPSSMSEYEPSDYDAPNQTPSLLMFTNDSDYMSPHHKPQSPPRLLMPDEQQQQQQHQNVPIINAPYGDEDMIDGPQFRIVPATPISGGDSARNVPFQSSLSSLTQGPEPAPSNDHQQSSEQQQRQRDASPSRFSATDENTAASSSRSPPNNAPTGGFIFPNDYSQQQQQQQQQQPRPRTHSDPWNPNFLSATSGLEKMNVGSGGTSGFDFSRQQLQTFTFGGASSTSNPGNGFLSPDSLRRSVSDAPRHHRQSRSEDARSPPMPYASNNSNYHHHQQSHSISGTTSASNTFLFPPPVDFHTGQQQKMQNLHPSQVPNLLNSSSTTPPTSHQQPHGLGLLSAAGSASNPNLSGSGSGIGHFRRASSGTRSDRGAEVWGSLGAQGHHGMIPRRMSPYPSPNASPRVRYTDLELDPDLTLGQDNNSGLNGSGLGIGMAEPVSAGFSEEVALSRRGSYAGLDVGGSQKAESVASGGGGRERSQSRQPRSNVASASQTDVLPSQIPKVNVTTGRTANASHRRRKQDANFACTVPGCGSTFTRGFNLKGHLRSHFEEKPYKCHWPGCGKGFARQHDCKRHEQLHSNFRPFECEGCKKQFARMDALNRHLRSEAGVECARVVEKGKGEMGGGGMEGGGYEMGGGVATMGITGGMVKLAMESEEQKHSVPIPKRRQSGGGGGGGGPDSSWSGVAL